MILCLRSATWKAYAFGLVFLIWHVFQATFAMIGSFFEPHLPLTRSPFSEHGEGFFSARSRTHWSLPPREGAEPARRMRCHRAKKLRDMDSQLSCSMYQRTKTAKSVQQKLELRDIVFILLEIVACRSYGFYFEHFILSCFSSHIR